MIIPKASPVKRSVTCCRVLGRLLFCALIPSLSPLCKLPLFLLSLCHHGIRSLDAHSIISNLSPSALCLPILAIPASFVQLSLKSRKISPWITESFQGDIFWWIWKNIEACMILVAFEQPSVSHPPHNIIISLCEMLSLPFVRFWSIEGEKFTLNF